MPTSTCSPVCSEVMVEEIGYSGNTQEDLNQEKSQRKRRPRGMLVGNLIRRTSVQEVGTVVSILIGEKACGEEEASES